MHFQWGGSCTTVKKPVRRKWWLTSSSIIWVGFYVLKMAVAVTETRSGAIAVSLPSAICAARCCQLLVHVQNCWGGHHVCCDMTVSHSQWSVAADKMLRLPFDRTDRCHLCSAVAIFIEARGAFASSFSDSLQKLYHETRVADM